jgi:uracil-DNA glycosylase
MPRQIKLEAGWYEVLKNEFDKPYFENLTAFLKQEKQRGKEIFPPGPQIFAALDHTPFIAVKVVIIGQDPYHGPGQAHGFCFSVPDEVSMPPSLLNICKELESDLNIPRRKSGNLTAWADQGVLLLNAILTVEKGMAGSHQNKGWETFTDAIIDHLNQDREGLIFMLWGNFARTKGSRINREKHLVLTSGHPSPLSAGKGHWFGNQHFSKANEYLKSKGLEAVDWGK